MWLTFLYWHSLQLFISEVKQYEPKVDAMFIDSQVLGDSSRLDKSDIDGVHKTNNALSTRWNAVNSHLINRQQEWVEFMQS